MEMKVHWVPPLGFLNGCPGGFSQRAAAGPGMSPHFRVRFPVYNYDLTIDDKGLYWCLFGKQQRPEVRVMDEFT